MHRASSPLVGTGLCRTTPPRSRQSIATLIPPAENGGLSLGFECREPICRLVWGQRQDSVLRAYSKRKYMALLRELGSNNGCGLMACNPFSSWVFTRTFVFQLPLARPLVADLKFSLTP